MDEPIPSWILDHFLVIDAYLAFESRALELAET